MILELKNIGIIREANIKIDGLTLIAGENDTGKTTAGKALFAILRARAFVTYNKTDDIKQKFEWIDKKIFKNQAVSKENSLIKIADNQLNFIDNIFEISEDKFLSAIFIETPFIWSLYDFFQNVAQLAPMTEVQIRYPYLSWDLFTKLSNEREKKYAIAKELIPSIQNIIGGDFIHIRENFIDKYIFKRKKDDKEFELENVAMGIKYFGILLALLKNNYITKKRILIFDEPEVHLHPKWQLELSKILVELVKNGVKVLVNSHSPYIIDALKYYADESKIENNFYLAEKNEDETSTITDATMDISPIFEKLTKPLRELRKMKLGLK